MLLPVSGRHGPCGIPGSFPLISTRCVASRPQRPAAASGRNSLQRLQSDLNVFPQRQRTTFLSLSCNNGKVDGAQCQNIDKLLLLSHDALLDR